jgi:tellurite resistance protein TehA-like permease
MTPTQRVFAIVTSIGTFLVVMELIRRRRLREEYAFLWVLTTVGMMVLATWYGLIERITQLIGAVAVTTTLFIFALMFLLLISVHFTTVLSRLTVQVRRLTQELAILQASRQGPGREPSGASPGERQEPRA